MSVQQKFLDDFDFGGGKKNKPHDSVMIFNPQRTKFEKGFCYNPMGGTGGRA